MKKVLVVLTRTLGDCLLVHNIADKCYEKFGECEIDVCVDTQYLNLIEGSPKVKKILTCPSWVKNWDKVVKLISSGEYDEYIVPQQLNRVDNSWHQMDKYRHQHLIDFYLDRSRLPKRTNKDKLQIYPSKKDIALIDKKLSGLTKFVVMHIKTLADGKDWDYFGALADKFMEFNIPVIQLGSKQDPLIKTDNVLYDWRELLSFKQCSVLSKKALCFVGLDSGLSYIAAGYNANVIVLQGATITKTSSPWGENVTHILSSTRDECREIRCHGNCKFNEKCINNITVDEVFAIARRFTDEAK